MGLTLQEVLMRALKKLKDPTFQRFIEELSVWEVREEYKNIPKDELTGKDPKQVTDVINTYYRYAYGAEVTLAVLEDIDEKKVREELQHHLRKVDIPGHGLGTTMFTDRVNFMDNHHTALTKKITDVDPVLRDLQDHDLLTQEEYNDVMKKRTSEKKMEDLCDIIRHWEDDGKCTAYKVLKEHEEDIIKDLEAKGKIRTNLRIHFWDHFENRHESYLINNIKKVKPVLDDLQSNHLLTKQSYKALQAMATPEEKIRYIFNIFWGRSDTAKDQLYISLWTYNYTVINSLERPKRKSKSLAPSSKPGAAGFLEKHRLDLISRVIMVDPILDDLQDQGFLEPKQYDLLRRQPSIRKKMTEVLDIVSNWEDSSKKKFFESLCAHNPSVIMDLQRAEKTDTTGPNSHQPGVQFTSLLYRLVARRNYHTISTNLETVPVSGVQTVSLPRGSVPTIDDDNNLSDLVNVPLRGRKHFVDEHCWDLIRRIILVDPVVDDLLEQNLVTQEQYDVLINLKAPQKKMIDLYDIVRFWTDFKKDQVYLALRQHNPAFIRVLEKYDQMLKSVKANKGSQFHNLTLDLETGSSAGEHFLDKNKSGLINVMSIVDPVVEDLREEGLLTEEQYHNILLKETSKEKVEEIYDVINNFDNEKKDRVYLAIRTHNYAQIRVLERISHPSISVSENSGDIATYEHTQPVNDQEVNQNIWVAPGSILFTIICCICMETYKNPVTLICGHNFCLECVEKTWSRQDSDDTSCPICRRRFKKRPELNKNLVLCQIAEFCQSTSVQMTHECCTYCTSSSQWPVIKQCLLCEAFLCEEHLKTHSKKTEHVIVELGTSPKKRRCSIHDKILEYYCSQDSACVCAHCCIVGEHKGHQTKPFKEAVMMKKDKLRDIEENLKLKKSEIEKSIKICMQKDKMYNVSEPRTHRLEVQEMREIVKLVQGGLLIVEGQAEHLVEDLIRQLEAKRSHLTQSIAHIEKLCYETDPFLVLQDQEDYYM